MARKDVDLVIRAKDEAEGVIKSITAAFNDFIDAQKNMSGQAGKTESALAKVGAAVGTVQRQLEKFDIGRKIADDVDKAAAAVSRLEEAAAASQQELNDLRLKLKEAETSTEAFQKAIRDGAAAVEAQRTAVRNTKTSLADLGTAYKAATDEQAKLAKRAEQLPAAITKQEQAVAKAVETNAKYREQMAGVVTVSASLQKAFDASERNVVKQTTALQSLRTELAASGPKLAEMAQSATKFAQEIAAGEATLKREQDTLAKLNKQLDQTQQESREAGKAQSDLQKAVNLTSVRIEKLTTDLARAKTGYAAVTDAAARFSAAVEAGTAASRDNLAEQIVEQGIAAQKAKSALVEYEESVRRLAALSASENALRPNGNAARQYAEDLRFASQAVEEASLVEGLHRESLQRMGQAFTSAGTDAASLARVQQTLVAEQQRLAGALSQVATEGFQQRQALREIGGAAQTAATGTDKLAAATSRAADDTGRLGAAYRRLHGDQRTTLDLTQRIRGQVLSLVAAYGGLFGVINVIGQVVNAYSTLEGAQARLNVANDGNIEKSAADLDFLRRNAERLGVELGVLATEFSKFAIATQGTNLEGEKTRKIFLAVAEAARVNRSSTQDMQGVFTALTQIVSKGGVQLEELRQQLGDRLPGAIQLMADGLGVTTAELLKMIEAGEVTADALVPFADELSEKFGAGLEESLSGVSAALGRLKNAAFQALVQFGNQGFLESFVDLLNRLTTFLQSAEFEDFSQKLSSAMAILADAVSVVVENFSLFFAIGTALLGLKLTPFLLGIVGALGNLRAAAVGATASLASLRGGVAATAAASTAASGAAAAGVGRLAALAGPIGLLVSAIGLGIGLWLTNTNEATEALHTHQELLDRVKNGYDAVSGSAAKWRDTVNDITSQEALDAEAAAFKQLEKTINTIFDALDQAGQSTFAKGIPGAKFFVGASNEYVAAVKALINRVAAGEVSVFDFREELDKLAGEYRDGSEANARLASQLDKLGDELERNGLTLQETQRIVALVTGELDEAEAAFNDLGNAAEDAGDALDSAFNGALATLQETVARIKEEFPQVTSEQEELNALASDLRASYEAALAAAGQIPDALKRAQAEQSALNGLAEGMNAIWDAARVMVDSTYTGFTDGVGAASQFIRDEEGFRADPYYDVNAFRAGYGSDTVTLEDGSVRRVTEGMRVTLEDANRDLERRLTQEFIPAWVSAIGQARFDQLAPQQVAALASLAYNYGAGEVSDTGDLRQVVAALRDGTEASVAAAIRNLGAGGRSGATGDVLTARRAREAALFETRASDESQIAEQEREREAAEQERQREAEATAQRLADGQTEISQQELINAGKAREAAIEAAVNQAKAENKNITDVQLQQVAEHAGRLFDLQQLEKGNSAEKEKAEKAEERVNQLLEQRTALQEQLDIATENGDSALADELKVKLEEVNEQLIAAIDNARAMWEAVGGAEGQTNMATLDAARAKAEQFGRQAEQTYFSWKKVGDLFLNGLASAFDRFSQAVAEGATIGEAAREAFLQFAADFLRQIGQMIIKQALFNALKGTPFGSLLGIGTGHTGGIVGSRLIGSGNATRSVSPAAFAGAMRYHSGGIAGLRPGEVPAILKEGENVQTESDPFHPKNIANTLAAPRSGGGEGGGSVKIVNAIDGPSFLEAALSSPAGERVLLNWMQANQNAVRSATGA
jgi:tape measure domain-containing protein